MGLLLSGRIEWLGRVNPAWLFAGGVACAASLLAIVWTPVDLTSPYRVLPAFVGGTGVILFSFALANWSGWKPICLLGRYSLEIYVAHTIFAAGTRIVLTEAVAHGQSGVAHWAGDHGLGGRTFAASVAGPAARLANLALSQRPDRFGQAAVGSRLG